MSPTLTEGTSTFLKRSNTVTSYLARSLKASNDPPYRKARVAADEANEKYRTAVRKLDRQRLSLEDRIETALKQWYIWELDRLRALKTVLLQYEGTIANLPKAMATSLERSSTLLASFQPESDLNVAIERYRTGPFRPKAHVYESVGHERADVVFGIDLRQWAGEGGWHAVRAGNAEPHREDAIPWIVRGLLAGLTEAYQRLPNDAGESYHSIMIVLLTSTFTPDDAWQSAESLGSMMSVGWMSLWNNETGSLIRSIHIGSASRTTSPSRSAECPTDRQTCPNGHAREARPSRDRQHAQIMAVRTESAIGHLGRLGGYTKTVSQRWVCSPA